MTSDETASTGSPPSSSQPDGLSPLPPFIASQGISVLVCADGESPMSHLSIDALRHRRDATSDKKTGTDRPDPWCRLSDRREFLRQETVLQEGQGSSRTVSLKRIFLTSDAGMGKSSALEWLEQATNNNGSDELALRTTVSALCKTKTWIPEPGKDQSEGLFVELLTPTYEEATFRTNGEAAAHLRRLRSQGKLTLILDGLDEMDSTANARELERLQDLMSPESSWKDCRIVIAGRPNAILVHKDRLFPKNPLANGWRFLMVDEFTEAEQRAYLGDALFEAIPSEVRAILTVPRVLYYLRQYVRDPQQIRSASDVYCIAIQEILQKGFDNGQPVKGAADLSIGDAKLLLSALAYELTIRRGTFDQVTVNDQFLTRIAERCQTYYISLSESGRDPTNRDWLDWVRKHLMSLSALNGPLKQSLLEQGGKGVANLQFRNRSLQEFFAAYWLANYFSEDQSEQLYSRLPLPYEPASMDFYWTFRFAAEMPAVTTYDRGTAEVATRFDRAWLTAMESVFRSGDGTVTGTRRANELIVRAWPTLYDHYYHSDEPAIREHARRIVDAWRGEFQAILDAKGDSSRKTAAIELTQSFVDLPGGTFKMGSPLSDTDRWPDEPIELELTLEPFSVCRFPMLNAYYRLYDPGHGTESQAAIHKDWFGGVVDYKGISPGDRHPAVCISWWDARASSLWFRWRATNDESSWYETTLVNEAQHEYVGRHGQSTYQKYWWSGNAYSETNCHASVGSRKSATAELPQLDALVGKGCGKDGLRQQFPRMNPAGVCDIAGNVWCWCLNDYLDEVKELDDVTTTRGGWSRADRGGSWDGASRTCRSASRYGFSPSHRDYYLGFRLARVQSGGAGRAGPGGA